MYEAKRHRAILQVGLLLIERADRAIDLIDGSKFQLRENMALCPLDRLDALITDHAPDPQDRGLLADNGAELVIAEALS